MALLILLAIPANAADPTPGLLREAMMLPVTIGGRSYALDSLVVRPDRPGRFPLVLIIHGTPRTGSGPFSETLAGISPAQYNTAAVAFARRGYATVAVMRRGFGGSDGPYAESLPPGSHCGGRDYMPIARISGQDVAAAAASLRRMRWVYPDRILLMGQSTGGAAVTAAAAAGVPGAVGILDFAGGRGSSAPDKVCSPEALIGMFAAFGAAIRLPALWIFAENDHFFGPDLARQIYAAYTGAGAPATLAMLPPFGADGHSLLTGAPETAWWPSVEPFLARLGLPIRPIMTFPPPADLPAPPQATPACRAGFREFLASPTPAKAFASSPRGGCGWVLRARTAAEARAKALANCNNRNAVCALYPAEE